ncbi:ADP-ribosylation factor-like protein 6-interacting protein 1 isoform X2 [Branchiostoma lanceolatum]|uniref:ADP-ribosylation factor-like protein 6-interacting protein 1 isoform X2 n=1 Tax=Branchiostoma lanceolatum TaxID=7740 RepID=UPI0034542B54
MAAEHQNRYTDKQLVESSQLEKDLQIWRDIIIHADRVLRWEKPIYPIILCSCLTVLFWTEEQQQRYHDICASLVQTKDFLVVCKNTFLTLKEEKPKLYFLSVMSVLATLAWVGNAVHNLLLTYLSVCFVSLLPGMLHHGILQYYYLMLMRQLKVVIDKVQKSRQKKD